MDPHLYHVSLTLTVLILSLVKYTEVRKLERIAEQE